MGLLLEMSSHSCSDPRPKSAETHRPRQERRERFAARFKLAVAASGALAIATGTAAPTPAQAKPAAASKTTRCDARGGTTFVANSQLRLFFARKAEQPPRGPAGLFICRNKGNVSRRLSTDLFDRSLTQYGASGSAWFAVRVSAGDGPSDAGRVYSDLITGDVATNRSTVITQPGKYLSDVSISPGGVVTAIAESGGVQPLQGDPQEPVPSTSSVVMFDPAVDKRDFQTIATGPGGTFTDLAASDTQIYWRSSDGTLSTHPLPARSAS